MTTDNETETKTKTDEVCTVEEKETGKRSWSAAISIDNEAVEPSTERPERRRLLPDAAAIDALVAHAKALLERFEQAGEIVITIKLPK